MPTADRTDDSRMLDYDAPMKDFIAKSLSDADDWRDRCVPHHVRDDRCKDTCRQSLRCQGFATQAAQ